MKAFLLAGAIALASCVSTAWAGIETRPVQFKKGASAATIKGTLKGDQTIDYSVQAKAGQTMHASFKPSNPRAYFNVLPPGSTGDAIFIGSSSGNEWTGTLPADGEYKIRTYLMRSAARRNETARFTLTIGIAGSAAGAGALGKAPAGDAKVKGTPYHATGKLPCAAGKEAPGSKECEFGVVRGKPGNAEVHVTYPGTNKRVLTFIGDKVSADGGARVKAGKSGDMWSVEVNEYEHYRIPEAVINGG
jgi:hypothetical protein